MSRCARHGRGPTGVSTCVDPYLPPPDAGSGSAVVGVAMNTYWATFAKTGSPNYSHAPAVWPAFAPTATDDDERLQFDSGFEIIQDFRKTECAFWRTWYASR